LGSVFHLLFPLLPPLLSLSSFRRNLLKGQKIRRTRQKTFTVSILIEEESGEEEDKEDDEGAADERGIWQVTDVTEDDLETTEGETVDLDTQELVTATDSEVLCRVVSRWAGQGGKTSLANTSDADILEFIISKLRARIAAKARTFLVQIKSHRDESVNERRMT